MGLESSNFNICTMKYFTCYADLFSTEAVLGFVTFREIFGKRLKPAFLFSPPNLLIFSIGSTTRLLLYPIIIFLFLLLFTKLALPQITNCAFYYKGATHQGIWQAHLGSTSLTEKEPIFSADKTNNRLDLIHDHMYAFAQPLCQSQDLI